MIDSMEMGRRCEQVGERESERGIRGEREQCVRDKAIIHSENMVVKVAAAENLIGLVL